jgi:hypothetical protein
MNKLMEKEGENENGKEKRVNNRTKRTKFLPTQKIQE